MRLLDLAVGVLQQHRSGAVDDAHAARAERRRVMAGLDAVTRGLDRDQPDARLADEPTEQPDGVRPAADARDDDVRQPAFDAGELGGGSRRR